MSSLAPLPYPAPPFDVVLRGYDQRTVDALVRRAYATLSDGAFPAGTFSPHYVLGADGVTPITAEELRDARIDVVLRGFDRAQVDDLLRSLVDHLAEAESLNARG